MKAHKRAKPNPPRIPREAHPDTIAEIERADTNVFDLAVWTDALTAQIEWAEANRVEFHPSHGGRLDMYAWVWSASQKRLVSLAEWDTMTEVERHGRIYQTLDEI